MARPFDYFVVFAEMRTGSNFLEGNLNQLDGVCCHGEAFNPHFIGFPKRPDLMGVTQEARDADPVALLDRLRNAPGDLNGFRYFHDHDPRILAPLLDDPRCAKIILTRNPVDSFVSWKIAQATDQWKLTNSARRKTAQAHFDMGEFDRYLADLQAFQLRLLKGLQSRGQTAFYVGYDDLHDLEVLNGLARWLGVPARLPALDDTLKRQNPQTLNSKVSNFEDMTEALSGFDRFDLARTPNAEPRRGPALTTCIAGFETPLLFLPMPGGPDTEIRAWMAALDGVQQADLRTGWHQKDLRHWMHANPGHRGVTILRHPVARAHATFCSKILEMGPGSYRRLRKTLVTRHGLRIPKHGSRAAWYDAAAHREAFLAFLHFVSRNLLGQTNLRIDRHWCSQASVMQGMSRFALPDRVLREAEAAEGLSALARAMGHATAPVLAISAQDTPFALDEIHDAEIERVARRVYARDYMLFGFEDWTPSERQAALTRSASVRIV